MDTFVIEKNESMGKKIKEFLKKMEFEDTPLFIFDIHNTSLTKENKINKSVYQTIKKLLEKKYQVIFLSYVGIYTGKKERIEKTVKSLNSDPLYTEIPKFFIKRRVKQKFMKELYQHVGVKMTLIDDNMRNIEDVNRMKNKNFSAVHFENKITYRELSL